MPRGRQPAWSGERPCATLSTAEAARARQWRTSLPLAQTRCCRAGCETSRPPPSPTAPRLRAEPARCARPVPAPSPAPCGAVARASAWPLPPPAPTPSMCRSLPAARGPRPHRPAPSRATSCAAQGLRAARPPSSAAAACSSAWAAWDGAAAGRRSGRRQLTCPTRARSSTARSPSSCAALARPRPRRGAASGARRPPSRLVARRRPTRAATAARPGQSSAGGSVAPGTSRQ
mmetsp:Transcript_9190/g.35941  ORF Transcript_9190/g.35941 Transcript_9190/m.35941 type:complete len:232 (-) Transcript_9190:672-1367(-)